MPNALNQEQFEKLIIEALNSGEPSPLTKSDINAARQAVKEKIAKRARQNKRTDKRS